MDGWHVLACPLIKIHWYSTGSARWWNIRWCIWLHLQDPLGYSQGPALMEKNWFMACSSESSGILSAFCLEEWTERSPENRLGIWVLLGPTSSLWEYPTASSNKDRPITLSYFVQLSCSINRPWGQNSEPSSIFINISSTFIDLQQFSSMFINLHRSSSIFINLHGQITSRSTSASPATWRFWLGQCHQVTLERFEPSTLRPYHRPSNWWIEGMMMRIVVMKWLTGE